MRNVAADVAITAHQGKPVNNFMAIAPFLTDAAIDRESTKFRR